MSWWAWLIIGLALFALEAVTPGGFFVLFFGVGAVFAGLAELAGVAQSFLSQGLIFVAVSVVALLLFRKPLLERFQRSVPQTQVDTLVGETAKALQDIAPGEMGTAELRGTSWSAQNIGASIIARAARCRVERVEGLTLQVRG